MGASRLNVPSITIFVRHSADCRHKGEEFYRRCKCSKHLRWTFDGKQRRESAKTRSWEIAEEKRRQRELKFKAADSSTPIEALTANAESRPTIERAIDLFVSDKRSQGLNVEVLGKYERELARLKDFMAQRSKFFPHEIGLGDLTEFRAGWEGLYPSSTTRSKVQERLRGFLRYCLASNWIVRVPQLSPIKVTAPPTLPLTDDDYRRLLEATATEFSAKKAKRIHAFIQLMRHSGLAIRDTTTLERSELQHDKKKGLYRIVTSRQKTGTHVSVPIPPDVAKEVLAAMNWNGSPQYIFWNSGTGTVRTVVTNWQNDIKQTFVAAGMPNGHSHQLRDTFAVGLLQKGIPMEEVSKLLGHTSIKTTEKHYSPWVRARQDRLDALVVGTFEAGL